MSAPLRPEELERYSARLRKRLRELGDRTGRAERDALEPSGGERLLDVDESVEETSLATELGVLAGEDELGYDLREALERIAQGTYGRCESCGAWLPRARLDLVPEARWCVPCSPPARPPLR